MNNSTIVATFTVPAVYSYTTQDWAYSALRFVVTDQADKFLVQYVLSVEVRS